MITKVEVLNSRIAASPIPFTDGIEETDPVQIRNIDGLGPVVATVNTTQYGAIEGVTYDGSTTGSRNIVLRIGFNPNWVDQTYESLRAIIYRYFMPKSNITLKFSSTHLPDVQIDGIVESCDPVIFSQDPEIQISIICVKPSFISSSATVLSGVTLPLPDGPPTIIDYKGNVDTGFVLELLPTATIGDMTNGEVRIFNEAPDLEVFIATASVSATNKLRLSTVLKEKYIQQINISTGVATSILGKQTVGSTWLQLKQGINNFRVASTVSGYLWTMTYYERYGGL